jgi:hypothetical protein
MVGRDRDQAYRRARCQSAVEETRMAGRPVVETEEDPDAGWSLPAWLYRDPEYFEVEVAQVLRPSWQIVCHVSDVADPGDWHTLDFLGESVVVARGSSTARAVARNGSSAPIMPGPTHSMAG